MAALSGPSRETGRLLLEYNYFDFGTPGVTFTSAADGVTTFPINIRQNINSFMVGINYRFGGNGY